jgi:hypothetical protein
LASIPAQGEARHEAQHDEDRLAGSFSFCKTFLEIVVDPARIILQFCIVIAHRAFTILHRLCVDEAGGNVQSQQQGY